MDLKNTMFSEISQRKEMLYDITYIQSEKQINVHSKIETESQIEKTNQWMENKLVDTGVGDQEQKLPHIKQIRNKDILCSTGKYSHSFISLKGV